MSASGGGSPTMPANQARDIFANLIFAVPLGTVLFLTFCFLRQRLRYLYSSNIYSGHQRNANLAPVSNGLFSWITSLLTLSDGLLLPLAGLDGYTTIQALKLTFGLMAMMSVFVLGILLPFYYTQSDKSNFTYMSFSITTLYGKAFWVPTVVSYIIAFVTFYVIYVFYRNFATLRQIYLTNPSALMSFDHLRHTTDSLGSLRAARKFFNVSTRTVLLQSVSSEYGPVELKTLLERTGVGEVESIKVVNSPEVIEEHLARRERTLNKLEQAMLQFYNNLEQAALNPYTPEWRAVSGQSGDAGRSELHIRIQQLPRLPVAERCELICRVLTAANLFPEHRPTHQRKDKNSIMGARGLEVDSLTHYYAKLLERETAVQEAIKDFNQFKEDELIRLEPYHITTGNDELNNEAAYMEKTALISLRKAVAVSENLSDVRTTLWGSSYSAIVVFKSKKAATACCQLLLSSRLYSLQAQPAPLADDLIWTNAAMPKADRIGRSILIDVLYVAFNLFFAPITALVAGFTNLKALEQYFPGLTPILDQSPQARAVVQGILAPLVYNAAISLTPKLFHYMLMQQGRISKSEIQIDLMSKYAWFLFFQTSIIGVVFASLIELIVIFMQRGWEAVIERIRMTMPSKSQFFANIIYQRTFVGLMLVLIQPVVLAKLALYTMFTPAKKKTARSWLVFQQNPIVIYPGILFPDFLVFPFQITMAFLVITPLSAIPGLLFYGLAAFIFKHQFVYSYTVPNESGGMYWRKLCIHLIFGLLVSQIFTVIQFFNPHRLPILPVFFMFLLISMTISCIPFLEKTFTPVCELLPLTDEDRRKKRDITCDLIQKQGRLLQVLQPVETGPKVFAELETEGGDTVEGWEMKSRPIDPSEIVSLASDPGIRRDAVGGRTRSDVQKAGDSLPASSPQEHEAASVALPIMPSQSSVYEARHYEIVPLDVGVNGSVRTFDRYDLDNLIDCTNAHNPYHHPAMLDHSQVIMMPPKLPSLLKELLRGRGGNDVQPLNREDPKTEKSPIAMGESALTEPAGSPPLPLI